MPAFRRWRIQTIQKKRSEGSMKTWVAVCAGLALTASSAVVWAADVDEAAAEALMKKSSCNKCHSLDKKKEGPSFKETSAKYKGKADAEEALFKHLTTNPKVKVDGKEEEHVSLKPKNADEVKNVVHWVLTR
jgi:cytochrome c